MSSLATIDALNSELDKHYDAHHTRLILADALAELGDSRAKGYRAIIELKGRSERFAPAFSKLPADKTKSSNNRHSHELDRAR